MASLHDRPIPSVKVEAAQGNAVKQEDEDVDMPSPYVDDDAEDETPDLDFKRAQQQLWISQVPRELWDIWSKLGDDAEIEIGTLRVEGPDSNPSRVSLMLNHLPQFELQHKEFILLPTPIERRKSKTLGRAFVFSEKNKKGYQPRSFQWDELDEDGNPAQGRSYLHENHKRAQKRKENQGRFTPYTRRGIPKETAITGIVAREFEMAPVKNRLYHTIENQYTKAMLKQPEKNTATFVRDTRLGRLEPTMTAIERQKDAKARQAIKQAAKDNRSARLSKERLIDELSKLFQKYRIWGLSQIKQEIPQPESWLRENLQEIAHMHTRGDFNGKWELNDDLKVRPDFLKSEMEAPKIESDMERSGVDDEDDDDEGDFIDVDM